MQRIQVIDSHTGGEPTRIVIEGGPDLGTGSMAERRDRFRAEFDSIRNATVNEPRGSDVLVGGLLCDPVDSSCTAGVIFFNTAGFLGMCGHGTIGLVRTLQFMDRALPGEHRIETPVGVVRATLDEAGQVAVQNVPSYRYRSNVQVEVPGVGTVVGDIAWGGNWFFLINNLSEALVVTNTDHLTGLTRRIRDTLDQQGITGPNGEYLDHLELYGPPEDASNHSRNFVLCPGGAYDRSPCGTGTSAKLACLAADEKLAAGHRWRQESIVGSVFDCSYERTDEPGTIIPTIRGTAHVCSEATLLLDPKDPFCMGIRG